MDPLSITAGVVGILQVVTSLSNTIYRFTEDCKLADEDLNVARNHALLLNEEIRVLELRKASIYSSASKTATGRHDSDQADQTVQLTMDEASFAEAMSTAHDLLSDIQCSFPLRAEPHTWRGKVRWALKDKKVLGRLKERLKSAESTLQGIVAMEQL
jgi:replication initiation and membrane attachment protein DnaB